MMYIYMKHMNKGISKINTIIIVFVLVVASGILYFGGTQDERKQERAVKVAQEQATEEEKIEAVFEEAPERSLDAVDGSGASGDAKLAVSEGKTYHRADAKNLPALESDDFYEGWLVKAPGKFFSTGVLDYNPETGKGDLEFITSGDKSAYRLVVITLEPNDGDPEPAKHVLEGTFEEGIDFSVDEEGDGEDENTEDEGEKAEGYSGKILAGSAALFIDFNQTDYEKALASDDLIVLYFYATWCPICRVEVNTALYPAFNELEAENVIGFRVNYNDNKTDDNEKALAREFGVAYQHTKVFVRNGEKINKWLDSWNTERYLEEISGALAS